MSFRQILSRAFAVAALTIPSVAVSEPFSAGSTYLISKQAGNAASPRAQLSSPSSDLRFTYDGKYAVFTTNDVSLDDVPSNNNRCTDPTYRRVFWIDGLDVPGLNANAASVQGRATCVSVSDRDISGNYNGDGNADEPYLSQDGRYVAFEYRELGAGTIDAGESITAGRRHIYVHDRKWEQTNLSQQKESPLLEPDGDSFLYGISANGQYLLLSSDATVMGDNLTPAVSPTIYRDLIIRNGGDCADNNIGECFSRALVDDLDFHAGGTVIGQLNQDSDKMDWDDSNSIVVFETLSSVPIFFSPDDNNKRDVFMFADNRYFRISQSRFGSFAANDESRMPTISGDGRYIAYESIATDLVATPVVNGSIRHIYLFDRTLGTTRLISRGPDGSAANSDSFHPRFSGNGRYIAYESLATNLVAGVTINPTAVRNVYLYDLNRDQTYLVTEGSGGTGGNDHSFVTDISDNGLYVGIESEATNLMTTADANGVQDVFIAANSCPTDGDADGTPDCIDECPADANKADAGSCGCGQSENDSDADNVPDCVDVCPGIPDADSDSDGVVDCQDLCANAPDTDANGNGAADCQDPTAATVPSTPNVNVSPLRGRASVRLQGFNGTVVYRVRVRGPRSFTKQARSNRVQLSNLRSGTYRVDYTVEVPNGATSQRSAVRRFRIR